jgi:amidase
MQAVMSIIAQNNRNALLYPHQRRLVVPIGEDQLDRNGVLSNSTGFPAITFPGGFSAPTASAPLGVPGGIELLGPDWSELILINSPTPSSKLPMSESPRRAHRRSLVECESA